MRTFTKFSLRFAVYLLLVAYLVADLFIFEGPIRQRLQARDPNSPEAIAKAKANGTVARVFNHPINRKQLAYAVQEYTYLRGKTFSSLPAAEKRLITYAALGELINHQLLRVKTKVNTLELEVSDDQIDARLKQFASRFTSRDELEKATKAQGIPNEKALRHRIAARIQQEKYLALRTDPLTEVSAEEIEDFYKTHKSELSRPALIHLRHIFIPTLDVPSAQARETLSALLEKIRADSSSFSTLAKENSQDPATKDSGGDLGWTSRQRLPKDFADQTFDLPKNTPTLIRTKIGWHIVEVTDRTPPTPMSLEEASPDISLALQNAKRQRGIEDFRNSLRKFEAHKIDIFHDQLSSFFDDE